MRVSRSAYYRQEKRPAKLITTQEPHRYRQAKALFKASRNSLGSRELSKSYVEKVLSLPFATRTLMRKLGLIVQQRVKYKEVNSGQFGVALRTIEDEEFCVGQANTTFSI